MPVAATVQHMMRTVWNARLVIGAVGGTLLAIAGATIATGIAAATLINVPFGVACAATVLGSATAKASFLWSEYAVKEVEETRR